MSSNVYHVVLKFDELVSEFREDSQKTEKVIEVCRNVCQILHVSGLKLNQIFLHLIHVRKHVITN